MSENQKKIKQPKQLKENKEIKETKKETKHNEINQNEIINEMNEEHEEIISNEQNNEEEKDIISSTVKFIEPDPNKKMTQKKKKRIEKAKQKINLKERRLFLFNELSKIMLTEDEMPNIKSTTKLGLDEDAENKENIIIMPKKAIQKEKPKKKVEEVKEVEKVTKLIINDGKKTFGFGFLNDQMEIVMKNEENEKEKKEKEKRNELTEEKVLFVNNNMSEDSDEDESENENDSEEFENESNNSNEEESNENESDNEMSEEENENEKEENNNDNEEEKSKEKEIQKMEEEKEKEQEETKEKENKKKRIIPIHIPRPEEIKEKRKELPILMEENNIIETILNNQTTIICGETGSGKTTQIPQILFEIGFGNNQSEFDGMIGITQPRRIAAVAMAKRVQTEMGEIGNVVSHQIRYDSTVSEETKIKFMTDGILLREAQSDVLLKKYSCIIIDEAHERSLNTDVLIGLLSRIIKMRNDKTNVNYKPLRLIIMSATLRVNEFVDNQRLFKEKPEVISISSRQYPVRSYFAKRTEIDDYCKEAIKKINKIHNKLPPGGILVFLTGHREIESVCEELQNEQIYPGNKTLHVLPLYSSLEPEKQQRIFEKVPEGKRLCVVATNIAETSITIPNIRYVVDSGRVKERVYDKHTGISRFVINWITKASAEQRSGRAGRVGEGYCYRLYSSNIYNNFFNEFQTPEIERLPLESIILILKGMGIDRVINFPFPSQISIEGMKRANEILKIIKLLDTKENITEIGKAIKEYPIHPRLGKILYLCREKGMEEIGLTLVAGLSVNDIYREGNYDRNVFMSKESDIISLIKMVDTFRMIRHKKEVTMKEYCQSYGIKEQSMEEILKLREQLCGILKQEEVIPKRMISVEEQVEIRKIIAQSYVDNVARLVRREEMGKYSKMGLRHAYITATSKEPVIISRRSNMYGQMSEYVIYQEIIENNFKEMVGVTKVNYKWLEDVSPEFMKTFDKKSFD